MSNEKISQRLAVYNSIKAVKGNIDGKVTLGDDERAKVYAMISEGFKSGTIEFKDTDSNREKLENPKELKSYVVGLVNNWLRKDPNLNGGVKYEAAAPGSRAGSSDAQIKELRKLRKAVTDTAVLSKIDNAIAQRLATLKAEAGKSKIEEVNMDLIPEDIKSVIEG